MDSSMNSSMNSFVCYCSALNNKVSKTNAAHPAEDVIWNCHFKNLIKSQSTSPTTPSRMALILHPKFDKQMEAFQ